MRVVGLRLGWRRGCEGVVRGGGWVDYDLKWYRRPHPSKWVTRSSHNKMMDVAIWILFEINIAQNLTILYEGKFLKYVAKNINKKS